MILNIAVLLTLCFSLAAPLDEGQPMRMALKVWERVRMRGDLDEQHAALLHMATFDHPRVVEAMLAWMPRSRVAVRPTMRRALIGMRSPESLEALREFGLTAQEPAARVQTALVLAEMMPPGASWRAELSGLLHDEEAEVRAAAVFALGEMRHAAVLPKLLELANDPAVIVRRRVPLALARCAGERSVAFLVHGLEDPSWRVRVAAARALGELPSWVAVGALVDALDRETGRVREALLESLRQLTGKRFGLQVDAWKRLIAQRDRSRRPSPEAPDETPTSVVTSVAGERREYGERTTFFDVPTLSDRFALVVDSSGSMVFRISDHPDSLRGLSPSLLEVAKEEARRLVHSLQPGARFMLVNFDDHARVFRGASHSIEDPDALVEAVDAISRWNAGGGTNLFTALEMVLDAAQAEVDGECSEAHCAPDTVFLLTDGYPNIGAVSNVPLLADYVAERNRDLDLRIHGVAFSPDLVLLERLTRESGGTLSTPIEFLDTEGRRVGSGLSAPSKWGE